MTQSRVTIEISMFLSTVPRQEFNGRHALAAQQDVKSREGHHSTPKCHDQRFCAHQPQFRQERDVSLEGLELQQGDCQSATLAKSLWKVEGNKTKVKHSEACETALIYT